MTQVALIGTAHIHTPGFIKMLKARPDVKVAAVWDHDAGRAAKRAADLSAPVVADLAAILKDPAITAVVICSETNLHKKLVLAAAKAGKHMFVEKPLGMSGTDARAMAAAIDKAKVLFNTGYFMRGNGAFLFLRDQIAKGNLGTITRIRGSNCHSGSLGGWFDTEWRWMADPKIAGCGAFGDLGTHLLDIMLWLMGDVAAATASIGTITGRYGTCDEYGEGLLRFKSGAVGTLAAGWVDVANPVSLIVSGTEGHATILNGSLYFQSKKVEGADGKQPWTELPHNRPHAFDQFLDAITGREATLVTAREAAYRNAVMEAMYAGARGSKWVKVAGKGTKARRHAGTKG